MFSQLTYCWTQCWKGEIFYLLFAVGVIVPCQSCPYQPCSCDPVQILCQSLKLTAIPPKTNDSSSTYRLLFLDGNKISTVPAGSLVSNLTEVSLADNPISSIDDHAFDKSFSTLEILTLGNARLTSIPTAFLRLQSLRYLILHDTNIRDWTLDVMEHLGGSLNILDLDNVGLTVWPAWLQYFTNLTELSISDSIISSVPTDGFLSQANTLVKLSLYNNRLTALPASMIQLKALQSLIIQGTRLADITWLPYLSPLTTLVLANNSISDSYRVSVALRPFQATLKYVDLQQNRLTSIPDLSFLESLDSVNLNHNLISSSDNGSLPAGLSNLYLAFNLLTTLPSLLSGLPQISFLNLPSNSINYLEGANFPPNLISADFGRNSITNLTDTSFPTNASIAILTLNDNPISNISLQAFNNLPNLNVLGLQNSSLTRLPLALTSLTSLEWFDVSGSKNLTCTCAEKSLRPVILNISQVLGTCGKNLTVENFFVNISYFCPDTWEKPKLFTL